MIRAWILRALGLLGLIALLLSPAIVWKFKQSEILEVGILDKTVPDSTLREHRGLVWLLNHFKYVKGDHAAYAAENDYFGYFPETGLKSSVRDLNLSKGYDLLYVTDTYGVYKDDMSGRLHSGGRSHIIYGGLQPEDLDEIRRAMFKGTSMIAEFNTFGSPTPPAVRETLYGLLGVRWTGWIGRYFPDLSGGQEFPAWAKSDYEKQTGKKWTFQGPGFLFVKDDNQVAVLEEGIDVGKKGNRFQLTEAGRAFIGSSIQSRYDYWFDLVEAEDSKDVLASYQLDLTADGEKKLKALGLPTVFPAVIRHDTGTYRSYYFAGDYADLGKVTGFYQAAGLDWLYRTFAWGFGQNQQSFYWKVYEPLMKRILEETAAKKKQRPALQQSHQEDGTFLVSRTNGMDLQVFRNGQWQNHFVKGVNMGMAVPGKWFTEFPSDEQTYLRWFQMIGGMNSNTIRVYTLMDPSFYRALKAYNEQHLDRPLWLLQEIWPEEHPPGGNFLDQEYNKLFHKEIELDVDAIHGNASIPERKGRAYGNYDSDVSPYVLGYLVGRELEPDEVLETDKRNKGFVYQGQYVSGQDATATEGWLAWSCDYLLAYEEQSYRWQHPVAIVSWPTLDAVRHVSEWNSTDNKPKYNDKAEVTIQHLVREPKLKSGIFGAYHIYPNYPDFMNNEAAYDSYQDEEGRLRYGGYLQEFLKTHTGYPALVAEFGLATGLGNAHASPDGYNHGGLTEETQGKGIVRMMKAIRREGYAGGLIFEWIDEWAKKTWTNEPYMIPYERHVLWHNAIDPEQNYGLLAMDAAQKSAPFEISGSGGLIRRVEMHADEAFLSIDVTAARPFDWSKDELLIGLDTVDRFRGEMKYRPDLPIRSLTGMEFLIDIKNRSDAKLLAAPGYNASKYRYSTQLSDDGRFEEIRRLINAAAVGKDGKVYTAKYEDGSSLRYGELTGTENHWNVSGNVIHLRLPWGRLNVTDPSSHLVLDDPTNQESPARDSLKTTVTDGVRLSAVWLHNGQDVLELFPGGQSFAVSPAYLWKGWERPVYEERLKGSYAYIQRYFAALP